MGMCHCMNNKKEEDLSEMKHKSSSNLPEAESEIILIQSLFRRFLARSCMRPSIELLEVPSYITNGIVKKRQEQLGALKPQSSPSGTLSRGPTRLASGSVYLGNWNMNGEPHGFGIMYGIDGGISEGQWKRGKLNGVARKIFPDGSVYMGEWVDGKKSGKGSMQSYNQNTYIGEWLNDLKHGYGEEKWADGSAYAGYYALGTFEGRGRFVKKKGKVLEGIFKNNMLVQTSSQKETYSKNGKLKLYNK